MNISLHKMARTTPAVRAEIAHPSAALARRFGITKMTVRKWRYAILSRTAATPSIICKLS